jgi:hypothetical protein
MGDDKAERLLRIQITKSVVAILEVGRQLTLFLVFT